MRLLPEPVPVENYVIVAPLSGRNGFFLVPIELDAFTEEAGRLRAYCACGGQFSECVVGLRRRG